MTSSTPGDPASQSQPTVPVAPPVAAPGAPPAPPAWAQQITWRTQETEPLEYHRLLRGTANYRWWKPLLLLVISAVYFGVFTVVIGLGSIPLLMAFDPTYLEDITTGAGEVLDTQRPVSVLISMVSIIIFIPAVFLGMLTMGMKPTGRVWSVAGRMRWGLLGRLLGAAALGVIVMNAVGIAASLVLEPAADAAPANSESDFSWQLATISMVLVLLLVPFQATAEEVVFRGLFMQVLGAWIKTPWVAILLPTLGFAAAHIYDMWGLAAVGIMGGLAAWLTWRTGGLEAAIAIHIVNNLVAFAFMAAGFGGSTAQTSSDSGPSGVIGEIVGLAVFAWLTLRICRSGGHGRERIDLIQAPVIAAPQNGAHHA